MAGRPSLSRETAPPALLDLPPSAKLVAKALEYEGDLTQAQLATSTMLPTRTVRYAVTELESRNLIRSAMSLRDARKRRYSPAVGSME